MPRWLRLTGIGCGGLFVFVIAVVACSAIISTPTETPEDAAQQEPAGGEAQQDAGQEEGGENTVTVGQPLTVGETAWIVTNAEMTTQLTDDFGETATGNFVVVDFEFTNNSPEAVTLDSGMLTLIDAEGRENEVDTDRLFFVPAERNIIFEQVNPGVTQQGTVIFTVAEGASGFTLELAGGFFASEVGYVDLGF